MYTSRPLPNTTYPIKVSGEVLLANAVCNSAIGLDTSVYNLLEAFQYCNELPYNRPFEKFLKDFSQLFAGHHVFLEILERLLTDVSKLESGDLQNIKEITDSLKKIKMYHQINAEPNTAISKYQKQIIGICLAQDLVPPPGVFESLSKSIADDIAKYQSQGESEIAEGLELCLHELPLVAAGIEIRKARKKYRDLLESSHDYWNEIKALRKQAKAYESR